MVKSSQEQGQIGRKRLQMGDLDTRRNHYAAAVQHKRMMTELKPWISNFNQCKAT
jgi:hypothetical protein